MPTIQDSKNLLVNWLNKNQSWNVQTNINKSWWTNTKGVSVNNILPNQNLKAWTQNKLQQKWIIQPTTTTNTRQQILDNDPNIQKIKQLWLQNDVRYAAAQQSQSRFIWLQNNNLNNNQNKPLTDLAWNVIQENLDAKRKSEFNRILNKPVLEIPTKKSEIENYNKKESERYRTDEQVIKDFHYDVRNSNWTLTKEQISQLYPEFQGKEDIALMLQADLLPLVQNDEFADMKKLAEVYPELLPKQKKVWDQILKDQEKQGKEIKDLAKKAEKTLSRYNVLSKNWQQYMEDVYQLGNFVDTIRAEYRLPWNPSDLDIINFGKERLPEVKELLDDMERLKSDYNLTERDRDIILNNWFDIWEWLYQAWADIQNFTQHNQLWDYLDKKSSTWERQLSNLWINGGSANTIANLPKKTLDTAEIPVNMVGGLTSWVGKLWIATERIATQQNRNEDWTTDYNGIVKDVIRWWGWALDIWWNTVMAIPTAIFHLANETEAGAKLTDISLWNADRWLDELLGGEKLEWIWLENNAISKRYNNQDEQTKEELRKVILTAILHKWSKEVKGLKERWELWVEAVNNAFMKAWKDPKRWKAVESFKENWIMDENWNVTPWNRKAVATAVAKEFTKTFWENLKTNFSMYNDVLRKRRWKTTVKDNRTFRDKAGEKAYNAGVKAREIYDSVKGWVETVKAWVQNINVWDTVKNTAEMVGKGVKATSDLYKKWKNAVTQWKNKVTNAVKENVVDPFKKWYEWVKDTVKENVVDPYNKGRWKTTVNKWTVKQEWQPQESNSTLKSDTKVNWDNYTEKKTNSKTLNNTQLQIQQNENRMNPSEIREFKNRYKKDYWQVMYEWWFTKTRDENIDDMGEYINNLIKEKSDSISSIEWTYKDKRLAKMIKYMIRYASRTQDDAMFDKYNKLSSKHSKDWITTKEADDMRREFSYKIKTWFWNDKNSEKIALATNLYSGVKDVLDEIAEANWFTDMRKINDEIAMRQHIRKWMIDKADGQSANNVYWINDYILMAEAFSNPETATLFVWKQLLKNKKIRNKVLNATVWWRKNAKNRITSESRQEVKNKIKSIAEWKKLQESMRWWKQPALPEYIKFSKITEIDKRKTTSEDNTPPTEWDTTEKKSETPKKESKPKNKVTAKKPVEKKTEAKTEVKEEKKAEQPKAKKDNKKLTIEERNAEFEKSVDENKLNEIREYAKENGKLNIVPIGIRKTLQLKNHGVMLSKAEIEILEKEWLLKWTEQPKEWKQLETRAETKQPEPKKDNVVTANERLKANWFEDIDTKWINLNNIDVKKMSDILNKSRDYRLGKDENWEYRVGYGDWTPKEKVNGDEAQLLMNIRDKKAPEEMKWYTWDKALTGAKLWYNKPTKNVATEKATGTEKPKNLVTNKPIDNSSITWRFRNLTLQDYKEMQKYQWVENQLINWDEEWYITGKIKAELLNTEKPLIPNAEIDESELYPVSYEDLKELVDKKKEIQDAERKLMKKNDDNLSQQIEDLRYEYDNEMLPNLWIYEVEDVDKAVSIIEKTMQDAHFQFFKDKEWIKPLVEKYWNYWEQWKSVDKKENTNIIGKNNSLTTKNTTNGWKDLWTAESWLNQGVWWASESRDLQRTDWLSWTERDNTWWISWDLHKEQWNNDLIVDGKSAWPAIWQWQWKLLTRWEARAINQSSKDILEKHKFSTDPKDYTAEEIETLRQYEWAGGLTNKWEDTKWVLDQFYTPQTAIDAVWHLVDKYKNGKDTYTVLEPTVWTGRFIRDRANEQYEWHEIDKTPWTIAQILHPEAKISVWDFEDQFMDFTGRRPQEYQWGKKDIVVWNPPYSQRITPQQKNWLEPKIKRSEEFFIKKWIDVLDDWWILAMVVPSTFLSNPMTYAKEQIFDNATLVDAYRLPEWVLPYTQVGTDIVVFKKSKSLFKRENNLSDNKRFEQHPEKVLGEVKERINRFGKLEKYVDWWWHPLDKLNAIYEDKKTIPETKKEQAENYSPVETREETPIKQKTTTEITWEKNKVTAKTTTKKKPTKKWVKIENQTLIRWDKTDIGDSVFGKWELDNKLLEYSKKTDINWYVEWPVGELVENDPKNLNYYKGHAVINDLYFAWDIYEKLEQLERDKVHISEAQYKKQKEWLQAVMPEPYTIENHPFLSPLDQNVMEFETNEIWNVYDSTAHDYVDKKLPIKDVFLERFRKNVSSSTVNKNLAREYINWEAMRSTSWWYGLSDEEKAAKARHEKSVVMEQVNEIFNDWLWNKLDKDVQQKILDKFNRENRSYVVPKYENMALATRWISKTFNWKPFKPQPWQVEWINFLLSKWAWIVAHWVGHWKTIEWVVATREAQLRWWNKRPLIVAPWPTLYAQWVRTIKELYPEWEIVNLWWLTKSDIKRLKDELWDDPRNWVKDGQVAILSMQWFGDHIEFRPNTQRELEAKLHDVMETKDLNVRQSESLDKKITQMLAPWKWASSDKYVYSEKWEFLRTMYTSLLESDKSEFIDYFTEHTKQEYPELSDEVIKADAEAMWNEKPVLLEDLGIDHITVDEMHNFKNVFTSAKMQEDEYWRKDVNRYGQIIKWTSSARWQKMYLATQYILDRNNNRNVFWLTATPFNNQPIEMYNMLSFVGRNELEKMWLTNINDFFSRFAEFREWLAPKASWTELEYKFIMKDFANARDLQRTITQFINYKWDSEDLIKPEKKLKVPVLKMSELQKQRQSELEYMALAKENQWDVLKATNGMISNLVSPFIVAWTRAPTWWKDFLDNSPKLKYFADVLKELRAEWKQDWMFIYMPVGQEFHELYAEALSEYAGVPREKIWIIDSKTSAKKDEIAEKFRSGEINVLIWGKNTAEWIDLQNNWYITAITSVWWNPTERVQVDGRVWRQWNFNNEVLSVVPLIENSADVIFMGKADQKWSRINNALEQMLFGGEWDLSADEMMMSLMTEPEKKARTQINIQSQEIDKEIYWLNSQKDRLQELKRRINDAQKDPEEIQKQIDNEKQAWRSWRLPSLKDELKTATKAKEWIDAYKENNWELPSIEDIDKQTLEIEKQVDELRATQSELKNNEDILNNLIEEIKQKQADDAKWVKTYEDYLDDIKSDFKNAKRFGSKEELKEYLDNKKKNVLANGKNKITNW